MLKKLLPALAKRLMASARKIWFMLLLCAGSTILLLSLLKNQDDYTSQRVVLVRLTSFLAGLLFIALSDFPHLLTRVFQRFLLKQSTSSNKLSPEPKLNPLSTINLFFLLLLILQII